MKIKAKFIIFSDEIRLPFNNNEPISPNNPERINLGMFGNIIGRLIAFPFFFVSSIFVICSGETALNVPSNCLLDRTKRKILQSTCIIKKAHQNDGLFVKIKL